MKTPARQQDRERPLPAAPAYQVIEVVVRREPLSRSRRWLMAWLPTLEALTTPGLFGFGAEDLANYEVVVRRVDDGCVIAMSTHRREFDACNRAGELRQSLPLMSAPKFVEWLLAGI